MSIFREFNIADWFSFYRIVAIPLLLALLLSGNRELFTWFLLVSYSTDAIDGFLARRLLEPHWTTASASAPRAIDPEPQRSQLTAQSSRAIPHRPLPAAAG